MKLLIESNTCTANRDRALFAINWQATGKFSNGIIGFIDVDKTKLLLLPPFGVKCGFGAMATKI